METAAAINKTPVYSFLLQHYAYNLGIWFPARADVSGARRD